MPDRELQLRIPVASRAAEVDWRAGDVAILATKLQDADDAVEELAAAAGRGLPVATAQNGVHGEIAAAARFDRVLAMLVWMPALHLRAGEVRLYAAPLRGVLDLGGISVDFGGTSPVARLAWKPRVDPLAAPLSDALRAAGFDSVAREDMAPWKRAKWLTNLGNAVEALVDGDRKAASEAAIREGRAVLAAAGLGATPAEELAARVASIRSAPIDGEQRPGGSTWQSLARGKPLETDFLNGALAQLARDIGVDAPVNAALTAAASATGSPSLRGEP
jgi:ketopantoate reductase